MRITLAFLITSFLLLGLSVFSQNGFLKQQDEIFRASTNQEMCKRIRISDDIKKCPWTQTNRRGKDSDTLFFCDVPVILTPEERVRFDELMFPQGDCTRMLTLASLCDLYFPLFQKKLSSKGLHKDCKWIPLVVSGCNASFKSSSGKSGLWAMDYLVARKNHLRVDKWIDERCGGDFTTEAAAAHIKDLLTNCNGQYLETLIAYLAGMPELNRIKGKTADLLTEADNVVTIQIKLMAYVKHIMETASTQNKLQNYFDVFGAYDGVFCERDIQFEAITSMIGIGIDELRIWNPVYCGDVIVGGYRRVPFMIDVVKSAQFNNLRDSLSNWQPQVVEEIISIETSYISYKVKRGDSIGKIAQKHKVSVQELKQLNGIKGNTIQQGKTLKIPVKRKVPVVKENVVPPSKPDLIPNTEPVKSDTVSKIKSELSSDIATKKPAKEADNKIVYVVKSGDSLWKIAKKYKGVTEKDIMKWNKIGENLRPGQRLVIYPGK